MQLVVCLVVIRLMKMDLLMQVENGMAANMILLLLMRITAFQLQTRNILKMILSVCFVLG